MYRELLEQDLDNPKYLFYGSPLWLKKINSDKNEIILVPLFTMAPSYAFKDIIEQNNKDCRITITNNSEYPMMIIENALIDENISGYIYAFLKDDTMIKDGDSYIYRCREELMPYATFKVFYRDYAKYYEVKNN